MITKEERKSVQNQKSHKTGSAKNLFTKGLKYLAISLPLLFISPIVVTIGFKEISRDGSYFMLILGCLLILSTIVVITQAFRLMLKSLFNK